MKEDEAKRAYRLYRHMLGTPADADALVYEEKNDQFDIEITRTLDRKFLILTSASKTTTEVRVISAADSQATPMLVEPRQENREYYVDHRNGRFYVRVNDTSRNFRIVTTPDRAPASRNWTELAAARPDATIQDLHLFAHNLVLEQRHDGLPQLAIAKLPDGDGDPATSGKIAPAELKFDEPDYSVALSANAEFDSPALRFSYTSLTTPTTTYDMNFATGVRTLLKQQYVGGGFDRANYREERLFATAADGVKIPISLVYRLSDGSPKLSADGPRPLLLDGYGSYGIPEDVYFSSSRLSLLDRGMIFAIAHVRGGGEYGREWYDGARLKTKPNTFHDFIAAAEYLQQNGYTTPDKTAIEGGSAGGLLMGAVLNERPELFHAAIAYVPWVDVLADMSDASIPSRLANTSNGAIRTSRPSAR